MSIRARTLVCGFVACLMSVSGAAAADGPITTFAGTIGGLAGDGGSALGAQLNQPEGMTVAADGTVLIADARNHRVRQVAPNGVITTVVGDFEGFGGDGGPAVNALLDTPTDVAFAPGGGYYIADSFNDRIRRVALNGTITTFAGSGQGLSGDGGPAALAQLDTPRELAVLSDGAVLVVDAGNHRIRKIAHNGVITTVAGTSAGFSGDGGPAVGAQLSNPRGVTPTADGGYLIADAGNNRIRKVDTAGVITTVGGGGAAGFGGDGGFATGARLSGPSDVVELTNGGFVVADTANHRIRRITPLGAIFTVSGGAAGLSGDGGPASSGLLNVPNALQFAPGGGLLVGDTANHRIRRLGDIGQVPDPELVRSIGVTPASGRVNVKPGTRTAFIPLRERDLTPNTSDIDAIGGALDVTVRNRSGALRTAHVSSGGFRVTQPTSGPIIGDLKLTDRLDGCRGTRTVTSHAATPRKKVRRLRVRVKGRFRTIGRYASAIARGTAWTITDRCDRTIIRVTEGTVTVRNLRTRKLLTVRAGQTRTILARSR